MREPPTSADAAMIRLAEALPGPKMDMDHFKALVMACKLVARRISDVEDVTIEPGVLQHEAEECLRRQLAEAKAEICELRGVVSGYYPEEPSDA